jgi:hypothetical protein
MNIHTHILGSAHSSWFASPSATFAMLCGLSYEASIQNLRVFTEVVLQVMTRCSLMGGYQRIGELTMSIFSNHKYSSTTTQHTTAWNLSIYLLPNFLPWSTFLLHIYSKPLNLHYLALLPMHFPLSCTFKMFFRIYLLIHSFFKHAYSPLFCSKTFISMFSAVTVTWHIPAEW